MRPIQITITLDGPKSEDLRRAAMRNLRKPKEHALILLSQALANSENQPLGATTHETQSGAGLVRQDQVASAAL